jgi:hypothetical protein
MLLIYSWSNMNTFCILFCDHLSKREINRHTNLYSNDRHKLHPEDENIATECGVPELHNKIP